MRRDGGHRRVTEIAAVLAGRGGLQVVPALTADAAGTTVSGPGWPVLARRLDLG
jgi:hypothetical protein